MTDLRKAVPCADCGGHFPAVAMDFDHRDPAAKHTGIAILVRKRTKPIALLSEIDKCDVVCANCHRVRTSGQRESGYLRTKPRTVQSIPRQPVSAPGTPENEDV